MFCVLAQRREKPQYGSPSNRTERLRTDSAHFAQTIKLFNLYDSNINCIESGWCLCAFQLCTLVPTRTATIARSCAAVCGASVARWPDRRRPRHSADADDAGVGDCDGGHIPQFCALCCWCRNTLEVRPKRVRYSPSDCVRLHCLHNGCKCAAHSRYCVT